MNTMAFIWLFGCGVMYVGALLYCIKHRHHHKTRGEVIMGIAGFLLMFVALSFYLGGFSWTRIIASTWIGPSSGLGFGTGIHFLDKRLGV
jgi:hypothetical protein